MRFFRRLEQVYRWAGPRRVPQYVCGVCTAAKDLFVAPVVAFKPVFEYKRVIRCSAHVEAGDWLEGRDKEIEPAPDPEGDKALAYWERRLEKYGSGPQDGLSREERFRQFSKSSEGRREARRARKGRDSVGGGRAP